MRHKVALISLPSPWLISDTDFPPLGVLYIANHLRQDDRLEVQVIDLAGWQEADWRLPEAEVYGVSFTTPQVYLAQRAIRLIRQKYPQAVVVTGGYHSSAMPKWTLANLEPDYVVIGDGEEEMRNFALGFRTRNRIRQAQPVDVDAMLWPARDMIDVTKYHQLKTNAVVGEQAVKEGYLITARGCPFNCGFCAQSCISRRRVRFRDVTDVAREADYLLRHYQVNRLYILDDTFVLNKRRVYDTCRHLEALQTEFDFDWHCLVRSKPASGSLYRRMYQAGCRQLTFGLEHFDNRILQNIDKRVTAANHIKAINEAKKANLRIRGQLIVGLPGETDRTVELLAAYIRHLPVDSWGVHIFVPLPGSPIWYNPEKYGFELTVKDRFDFFQTIGKPGQWKSHLLHKHPLKVKKWAEYLRQVAGERNVYAKMKR